MVKTIKIGNIDVALKATANTPRLYRATFNQDLLVVIMKALKEIESGEDTSLEFTENLAYIMAKQADETIGSQEEWLDQFGMMDIYNSMEDIVNVWVESQVTTSNPKKK